MKHAACLPLSAFERLKGVHPIAIQHVSNQPFTNRNPHNKIHEKKQYFRATFFEKYSKKPLD